MLMFSAMNIGLYAQQNSAFSVGARAGLGVGFSDARDFMGFVQQEFYPDVTGITPRAQANFNIALYGNYAFNNFFSLQPELNFMIYQGYDMDLRRTDFMPLPPAPRSIYSDLSYSSLDIPLLVKINFLGSNSASFGVLVGPHVSLPLGRAEFWRQYAMEVEDYFRIDNSAIFGLTAGVFCRIPLGVGQLVGDLRFVYDFDSLKASTTTGRFDILQRRALVLSVGYEISF